MAGYNPLETIQAMRHQQAMNDQQSLAQSQEREAMRLDGELQAKEAQRIQVMEEGMRNVERQDRIKQQEFSNGITLMEKEAELSERLGRDIRGELGKWTGRGGEEALTGDQPQRREQIARAGVQAEQLGKQEAEVSHRQRIEEQFNLSEQKKAERNAEWDRRNLITKGTVGEQAQRRGTMEEGRQVRTAGAQGREGRAQEKHPLDVQRKKQLLRKGTRADSPVKDNYRTFRVGIKSLFDEATEAVGARYKSQSGALYTQSGGEEIGRSEAYRLGSQAKGLEKSGAGEIDALQGPKKRVLGIIDANKGASTRELMMKILAYAKTLPPGPAQDVIKRYLMDLKGQVQ